MLETIIIQIVAPLVLAFITYILARQKNKVEVDKLKLELKTVKIQNETAELSNIEMYRNATNSLLEDLSVRVEQLLTENQTFRKEIYYLTEEIKKLKQKYPCDDCPRRNK